MLSEVKKQENRKRTMTILSKKREKLKNSKQAQCESLTSAANRKSLLPLEVCQGVTVKSKLLSKPPPVKNFKSTSSASMKNSIGGKGKASAINKIFLRLIDKPSHCDGGTKAPKKTKQSSTQPSSARANNDNTSSALNNGEVTDVSSRDPVTPERSRKRDLNERYVELFGSATPPTPGRSIEHLILGQSKLPKGTTMI